MRTCERGQRRARGCPSSGCQQSSLLAGRARELVKTASGVGLGREGLYSAEGSDVQYSTVGGDVQYSTATINAD
jgi:hypothetical protein